jgi:hypothetical protein
MAEVLTTAGIVTLCVITGCKLVLSIASRIKKSKCVDSKGREVELNFGSDEDESETSETPKRHKRHRHKRHSHKRKKSI